MGRCLSSRRPARGSGDLEGRWGRFIAAHDFPCPGCGYNLRGLSTGVCPECGAAVDREAAMYVGEEIHLGGGTAVLWLAVIAGGGLQVLGMWLVPTVFSKDAVWPGGWANGLTVMSRVLAVPLLLVVATAAWNSRTGVGIDEVFGEYTPRLTLWLWRLAGMQAVTVLVACLWQWM